MLKKHEVDQFIRERSSRRITQDAAAKLLDTNIATMNKIELGKTSRPQLGVEGRFRALLAKWVDESKQEYRPSLAAESRAVYMATYHCPTCHQYTPGAEQGAQCCIHCGDAFPDRHCPGCQTQLVQGMQFCPNCGKKLTKTEKK